MIYLTFNDAPSGIYTSQVIDTVKFLNNNFNIKVRLVAFISIRDFFKNRKKINKESPAAIVIPMIPRLRNWEWNKWILFVLCIFLKPRVIIARSMFATNLALEARKKHLIKKVCYDGREAFKAECHEYNVLNDINLLAKIDVIEKKAIIKSDYRIAVSCHLIEYWEKEYGYNNLQAKHIVIPCTLPSDYVFHKFSNEEIHAVRKELGFDEEDILLVYSGSIAGWQSFKLLTEFVTAQFQNNSKIKILLLTKEDKYIQQLKKQYPDKVKIKWVEHKEVNRYLYACDYGLLVREQSITNKVASPTKFAEYLACGLPIIISENLGDYSTFVKQNNCGVIFLSVNSNVEDLHQINLHQKENLQQLAFSFFSKQAIINQYSLLLCSLYE